jgi:hypothetical protein
MGALVVGANDRSSLTGVRMRAEGGLKREAMCLEREDQGE